MKFSLILSTLNRTDEVGLYLKSLDQQTYRNFELIVVDQNPDDRLTEILQPYHDHFSILHLRSAPGLSRARNVGLQKISGDVVAFPDDDCCYPSNLLERVSHFFNENLTWDGITGHTADRSNQSHPGGKITRFNAWKRGVSYTIFLKASVVNKVGNFDETLGVGAGTPWGASEEIDYLLRAIEAEFYLNYEPTLLIVHPSVKSSDPNFDESSNVGKVYHYAMGDGRVLRKHRHPLWFIAYSLMRSVGGAFLSLLRGSPVQAKIRWAYAQGKLRGWLGWA